MTSASTGSSASSGLPTALCTFLLNDRRYGLDVALVGEVVSVDGLALVPLARPGLRGVFNLRGTPIALVDASVVLGAAASSGAPGAAAHERKASTALVLARGDLTVALEIERMEAVLEPGRGRFSLGAGGEEHPVVHGLLEVDGGVVTVLDPASATEA
jgi:chemotaxis signal transduction protein